MTWFLQLKKPVIFLLRFTLMRQRVFLLLQNLRLLKLARIFWTQLFLQCLWEQAILQLKLLLKCSRELNMIQGLTQKHFLKLQLISAKSESIILHLNLLSLELTHAFFFLRFQAECFQISKASLSSRAHLTKWMMF